MAQLLKHHCWWPARAGGCPEPGHTEAASVDRLQQAVRKCDVWIAWVSRKVAGKETAVENDISSDYQA